MIANAQVPLVPADVSGGAPDHDRSAHAARSHIVEFQPCWCASYTGVAEALGSPAEKALGFSNRGYSRDDLPRPEESVADDRYPRTLPGQVADVMDDPHQARS